MTQRPDLTATGALRLRLIRRGRVTRSFKVKAKTLTIGSGASASFRVKGVPDLAPEHALVWLDEGIPILVPSSGFEVRINGASETQARPIDPSDVVSLGGLDLMLEAVWSEAEPTIEVVAPEVVPNDEPSVEELAPPEPPLVQDDREATIPDLSLADMLWDLEHSREPEAATPAAPLPEPPPEERSWAEDIDVDDEDEEDEFEFVEPFSLVEHLRQKMTSTPTGPREQYLVAQVVRHSDGRVWDVRSVHPGQRYELADAGGMFLEVAHDGVCSIPVPAEPSGVTGVAGTVGLGETEVSLASLASQGTARLSEGDWATLETNECSYIVSVMRPPRMKRPSLFASVVSAGFLLVYAFAVTATVGGGALAFASNTGSDRMSPQSDQPTYAEVRAEDLALLPAKLDLPEDEPVEPEVEDISTSPATNAASVRGPPIRKTIRTVRPNGGGGGAASKLLAALTGGGSGPNSNSALSDIITNIDSVGSNSQGLFRVPGVAEGLPDGVVKVARRGGPGGETIGVEGLRSKNPFLGVVQPPTREKRRPPRGRVVRLPPRPRGPGEIDPAAVRRVIERHIGAITRCYESRLMSNPGLNGRLVMAWTITPSGAPSGVRARASTLGDPRVGSCVTGIVRRMRFPRPRGGTVTITYPFIFRSVD